MANIAVAKLSKSIKFNQKAWSPIGGDNEAPLFIYALAKMYPQHDFWIIGRSDYSSMFPNGLLSNIHDIWNREYWNSSNPDTWIKHPYEESKELHWKYYQYVDETLKRNNIHIDFAFILYGMFVSCSMADVVKSAVNEGVYTKPLMVGTHYSSSITYFLNEYKGEYASLVTDPRSFTSTIQKDLAHWPVINLSQINATLGFPAKTYTQYWPSGQQVAYENKHLNVYSALETMNLLSRVPYKNFPEKTGFAMICNQGYPGNDTKKPSRYIELKKWILDDPVFECSIYGKWDEDIIQSDKRFKGPVSPAELGTVLENVKYTLCIPITSGWITAKFVEMLHYGVIPFITKDYGSNVDYQYIPKECIVNSISELKTKIDFLDKHPEVYNVFLNNLLHILDDKYTGSYLMNYINKNLQKYTSFDMGNYTALNEPISVLYKQDADRDILGDLF